LVLPAPIHVQFRNRSFGIKVDGKDFGELFDTKRPTGDGKALQEAKGVLSIRHVDFHQNALVCLI
jgi:hypothetical protein